MIALFIIGFCLVLIGYGIFINWISNEPERCEFYEDGEHQCWRFTRWYVERECYRKQFICKRHNKMRLA